MELRKGYKQTTMGIIPEDWDISPLDKLTVKVGSGITPTGGEKVYKKEGRPFLRSQNVGWGLLLLDDIAFIDEETHASFSATEIKLNDVLLNITGASIGRSAVADARLQGGNVNQHVCIIRVDVGNLNPKFLNLFLLSTRGQKQVDSFQAGGNRQGLNFGQIKSFQVPLPSLTEQRDIAAALSNVDALITSLDQLIAKKRLIKQGAMQELLTGKKRLPGFSGEWGTKKLGEISNIIMGQSPDSNYYNYDVLGIPLIQGNADLSNRRSIQRVWTTQITKSCLKDDLLLTVRAPVGSVGIATEASCIGRGVCALRPTGVNKIFLYHTLVFNESAWKTLEQGSTFTAANSKQVSEFSVAITSSDKEQKAVAEILSDMDDEIAALEQRRAKTRLLKQGMMQELLTGNTRLT